MEQPAEKLPIRPGFYWVRLFGIHWSIAQYTHDKQGYPGWFMTGHTVPFSTDDFEEIGEEVLPQHYDQQSTQVAEQLGKAVFKQYDKDALMQKVIVVLLTLTFLFQTLMIIKLYK